MIRPIEDIALARITQAEEEERRWQAIRKATRICGPRPAAYFLANALGMSQAEIGEMAGITKQAVGIHIRNFRYYLKIVYRRPKDD